MLVLAESELSPVTMSSESSVVPCQGQGPHMESMTPGPYHDFPNSPQLPASMTHQLHRNMATCTPQSLEQHNQHHQWDINDIVLPMPEVHETFELWPSGHCRKVYRGDSDDARRHVSGWAMRNTNNHNALILKKSCLGVLVCSMDCLLDSGRKVHLRPAICDKARRKQMGKPCPNPGCSGKLDLLSCRGHCGYPVTHFWRHVNGSVYFQAKGYHDHPRPEVKSLSEKGRHAFSKQLKQEGSRLLPMPLKRRFPILTTDDLPDRKMFIPSQDDVMCSCPPFECVCPKSLPHNPIMHSSFGYRKESPPHPFIAQRTPPSGGLGIDAMSPAPFTQINITNTCLPPSSLDVSIPGYDVSIPGYDVYKNCPKFAYHAHCHDNDLKMFTFGGKDDTCNGQAMNRSPAGEYRPSQLLGSNPPLAHNTSCSPRPFNAYPLNFASGYEREGLMRYRLSGVQNYSKSPSSDARSDSHGHPIKSEPLENTFLTASPHSPQSAHTQDYHNDIYQAISPAFHHQNTSPRQTDCLTKYGSPANEYSKEQSHQEPTYITLTSPQRHMDEGQGQREFNSCRLSHVTRSPNIMTSSPDNVIYPPPPTQPTRVDNVTTPPLTSAPLPQRQTSHRDLSSQTRRSPAAVPHRLNATTNETITFSGNPSRVNSLPTGYAPLSTHQESPLTPFSVNSDPCLSGFPPGSSSLTSPYGYYCNDMFQTPTQQAYRNRSINITLTYN